MIKLPLSLSSSDQLGELSWEIERRLSAQQQVALQQSVTGQANVASNVTQASSVLLEVAKLSGINVDDPAALEALKSEIAQIRESVPTLHMLVATYPTQDVKDRIVNWLRSEIHEHAMCRFVVRGDLGGGYILRTRSREYDMSFRGRLLANKPKLVELFAGV